MQPALGLVAVLASATRSISTIVPNHKFVFVDELSDYVEFHLQRCKRCDSLLLPALHIHLASLLRRLAVVRVVVRRVVVPRRRVVLRARVLVVRAWGSAWASLHWRSWRVLVLLLGSCKQFDVSECFFVEKFACN